VGCCNRLGRATWAWPTLPRVSPLCRLYKLLPGYRRTQSKNQSRVLPPLATCTAYVVYSIPSAGVHRQTESRSLEPLAFVILYRRGRIRFLGSALRDCSSSSSRVVFHPSRAVLPTAVFIVVYFDRSSLTLSSTTLLLRLHLQANGTCGVLLFPCSSCSASTCFAATYFRSSCCSVHLVCSSYMW
jgi:hypothetical protein